MKEKREIASCRNDDSVCDMPIVADSAANFVTESQVGAMCAQVNRKLNAVSSSIDDAVVELSEARLNGDREVLRVLAEHEDAAQDIASQCEDIINERQLLTMRLTMLEGKMEFMSRLIWVFVALSAVTAAGSLTHVISVVMSQ